jgi:hypothetical protein
MKDVLLRKKSQFHSIRHSGENRDPVLGMVPDFRRDDVWTPAFAGVTLEETFCEIISL